MAKVFRNIRTSSGFPPPAASRLLAFILQLHSSSSVSVFFKVFIFLLHSMGKNLQNSRQHFHVLVLTVVALELPCSGGEFRFNKEHMKSFPKCGINPTVRNQVEIISVDCYIYFVPLRTKPAASWTAILWPSKVLGSPGKFPAKHVRKCIKPGRCLFR